MPLETDIKINHKDITLVFPAEHLREDICDFRQEMMNSKESGIPGGCGLQHYEFEVWLDRVSLNRTLPKTETTTPADTFLVYRVSDGRLLGTIQLRHYLTKRNEIIGGNIGYAIRPSERRKGYAKQALEAVLDYAKSLGLDNLRIDCEAQNVASQRTIEACGGKLEKEFDASVGEYRERIRHYRVKTKNCT